MNSIKAILAGSLFIFIAGILLQLAYIFMAVGYNALAKNHPALHEISPYFRYLIGIPVFIIIMFIGGYLTALIAKTRVLLHSGIVGILTVTGMMWPLLDKADLTVTGIVVSTLSLIATLAGGWSWNKKTTGKTTAPDVHGAQ